MIDFKFENLDARATKQLISEIASEIEPIVLAEDKTTAQVAALPFYDEFKLYALSDATLPAPNTRYILHKPGDVSLMNWTNEPIYSVNERAPIKLDRKTAIPYAKFFFHYVRGQLGRFIIVERPEEVVWLANANDKEKADVAARLMPVTYKGVGRDNLFTLSATVVFKNALFSTDIKIAPYEMDVFDTVVNPYLLGSAMAVERFHREVQAAARLHHPNIVTAFDADQAGSTHFLVMEFVDGMDLGKYVKAKGPLPAGLACHFIRQAALGLQHAHEHGMVHRDIKPHNLMMTAARVIKVMDFGLARLAREEAGANALTGENVLMGTADYMAPEQARDAHKADIRADIYSLGCTLFHLVRGRPPFGRGSAVQKIAAHLLEAVPLDELPPSTPPELRAVLAKMLEKDPALRYQAPAEVVEALAPLVRKTISTNPAPPPAAAPGDANSEDVSRGTTATPAERQTRGPSWRKWSILGSAVIAASILAVSIAHFTISGSHRDEAEQMRIGAAPDVTSSGSTASLSGPVTLSVGAKSARYRSVNEAVQQAPPGARVEIEPGTYRERPTTLNSDIEIVGLGSRKEVRIVVEDGSAFTARAKKALLRSLTIQANNGSAVFVPEGECCVEDCSLSQEGGAKKSPPLLLVKGANSTARLTKCDLHDATHDCGIFVAKGSLFAFGCKIRRTHFQCVMIDDRATAELDDCQLDESHRNVLWVHRRSRLTATNCRFGGAPGGYATLAICAESQAKIHHCQVSGGKTGAISVTQGATAEIANCDVTKNNGFGLSLASEASKARRFGYRTKTTAIVSNSRLSDNKGPGIVLKEDSNVSVTGCDLRHNIRGAWEIAPGCTVQRENNQEPEPQQSQSIASRFTNSFGMEFVLVGRGVARLGGGNGNAAGTTMPINYDYYLGVYEVTQGEWESVTGSASPAQFSRAGLRRDAVKNVADADLKRFPVESISWDEAQRFLSRLNERDKLSGWVYRLPKEVEWEYACRGGPLCEEPDSVHSFYFAEPRDQLTLEEANFKQIHGRGAVTLPGLERTCKVGSYQPNRLGLYDMHGNVWEWCDDWHRSADGTGMRGARSGGWDNQDWVCRAAHGHPSPPGYRNCNLGLRVARVSIEAR